MTPSSHDLQICGPAVEEKKVCQVVHQTLEGKSHIHVYSLAGETLVEMPVDSTLTKDIFDEWFAGGFVEMLKRRDDEWICRWICCDLPVDLLQTLTKCVADACSLETRDIRLINADGQPLYVEPVECLPCVPQTTIGAFGRGVRRGV